MPYYECVFIARQDVSAAQVESLTDDFSKVIEDGDGKVPKKESWGLRSLAYKIKHNRKGHYTLLNINAPAAAVQEMERLIALFQTYELVPVEQVVSVKSNDISVVDSVQMKGRALTDPRLLDMVPLLAFVPPFCNRGVWLGRVCTLGVGVNVARVEP